jgi:3-deoxy-7-phosphoheptulonate synthase
MAPKHHSLPNPNEIKDQLPLSIAHQELISTYRNTICNILNGTDSRLLLIVGPCSIHHFDGALAYASRLKELQEEVSNEFFLVMRTHFEKPRTKLGWKGFCYDPDLNGSSDIESGITLARKLLLTLVEMGVPAGTEFLDPGVSLYYNDLISWGSIGARTSSSQIHRQMASGMPMPIGIKNSISGDIDLAIDGIVSASESHTFLGSSEEGQLTKVQTEGNRYCHLVLRGGNMTGPNYDSRSVSYAINRLTEEMCIPRLLIDCSHDNSGKDHHRQPEIYMEVLAQSIEEKNRKCEGQSSGIAGMIIESYLQGGHQSIISKQGEPCWIDPTLSLTDPCLDWETTQGMILEAAEKIRDHAVI